MGLTQFYLALVIGICLSLLVEEFLGINCGGSICPGYLAMVCDDIPTLCIVLVIVILIYLIVQYVLPRFMILYGRRKFAVILCLSVIFKLAFERFFPLLPFVTVAFRGVGVMSTGVLASNCIKQGFRYTLPACIIVTALTYGLVQVISLVI